MQGQARGSRGRLLFVALVVAAVSVFSYQASPAVKQKFEELHASSLTGSPVIRANLLRNGVSFVDQTAGLGAGLGGFERLISNGATHYSTGNVLDPHDLWIEIAVDYGLFIFALFSGWFVHVTLSAARWARRRRDMAYWASAGSITICCSLLGYLFASVETSSYLAQPTNWVFLATVLAVLRMLKDPHPAPSDGISAESDQLSANAAPVRRAATH
jgi:O-antigen ligase